MYGIDNSLHTRKVTFRLREEVYAKIVAIVESEPVLWNSQQTVSSYIQRLISADLNRREEEKLAKASWKPPADAAKPPARRGRVRQK